MKTTNNKTGGMEDHVLSKDFRWIKKRDLEIPRPSVVNLQNEYV